MSFGFGGVGAIGPSVSPFEINTLVSRTKPIYTVNLKDLFNGETLGAFYLTLPFMKEYIKMEISEECILITYFNENGEEVRSFRYSGENNIQYTEGDETVNIEFDSEDEIE